VIGIATKRKSKAQLEQERAEKERIRQQKEREKLAKAAQQRAEAQRREWLRKERSRSRTEMPAQYGEVIHVHKRVLDGFMKQVGRKIEIATSRVVGGTGGSYILEYTTKYGGRGKLELFDLGPMPQ